MGIHDYLEGQKYKTSNLVTRIMPLLNKCEIYQSFLVNTTATFRNRNRRKGNHQSTYHRLKV